MDTLKNFLVGVVVIILSVLIIGIVSVTWPILMGIGSVFLTILAAILFIVLIFYIVVLIGHITRQIIAKK